MLCIGVQSTELLNTGLLSTDGQRIAQQLKVKTLKIDVINEKPLPKAQFKQKYATESQSNESLRAKFPHGTLT